MFNNVFHEDAPDPRRKGFKSPETVLSLYSVTCWLSNWRFEILPTCKFLAAVSVVYIGGLSLIANVNIYNGLQWPGFAWKSSNISSSIRNEFMSAWWVRVGPLFKTGKNLLKAMSIYIRSSWTTGRKCLQMPTTLYSFILRTSLCGDLLHCKCISMVLEETT